MVTAMSWNEGFKDLFAVGYGSYDFMRQGSGLICVFSMKNVGAPEYTFTCESGVTSMDFHSKEFPLLAVGLYDGSVCVYDVRKRENKPIYSSDAQSGKHSDPVWEVHWARDDALNGNPASGTPPKEASFYSVSSDGRLASWTVTKSELVCENLISLNVLAEPEGDIPGGAVVAAALRSGGGGTSSAAFPPPARESSGGDGGGAPAPIDTMTAPGKIVGDGAGGSNSVSAASGSGIAAVSALRSEVTTGPSVMGPAELAKVVGLAGCCCFAFNPFDPSEYLVGTEEGRVHKGNLETPGSVVATFALGHSMAVYCIKWNPWHPRVFLTCSADWTVRVWDSSHTTGPILCYDMNNAVADGAWAPYSSTVFAVACEDSKVAVWDLSANKKEPLCLQKVSGERVQCAS